MPDGAPSFRLPPAPPSLTDGTVHLRAVTGDHVELLVRGSHDAEVTRWTLLPAGLDAHAAAELLDRWSRAPDGMLRQWAVAAADGEPVGVVSLIVQDRSHAGRVDVAYWLLPDGRGRGLASRAVRLLVDWTFATAGAAEMALYTKPGNVDSERVAERTGFTRTPGTTQAPYGGAELTLHQWLQRPPAPR